MICSCDSYNYKYVEYHYNPNEAKKKLKESEIGLSANSKREALMIGLHIFNKIKMLTDSADRNYKAHSFKILDKYGEVIFESKRKK